MDAIKAIETSYRGYRFRSRLEARWAVFFDALGIKWEYEAEGFDLGEAGWYLPDFRLPELHLWVEIKPTDDTNDSESDNGKWLKFARSTGQTIVLLCGGPDVSDGYPDTCKYRGFIANANIWDNDYFWCECPKCGNIGIEYSARSERIRHKNGCPAKEDGSNKIYNGDSERIRKAVAAARSARFEHGENRNAS